MKNDEYEYIIVESHVPSKSTGKHGLIHIRPVTGQEPFLTTMLVRCSKELSTHYSVGTKFRIRAKITSQNGGTPFIHSPYAWKYEVLV